MLPCAGTGRQRAPWRFRGGPPRFRAAGQGGWPSSSVWVWVVRGSFLDPARSCRPFGSMAPMALSLCGRPLYALPPPPPPPLASHMFNRPRADMWRGMGLACVTLSCPSVPVCVLRCVRSKARFFRRARACFCFFSTFFPPALGGALLLPLRRDAAAAAARSRLRGARRVYFAHWPTFGRGACTRPCKAPVRLERRRGASSSALCVARARFDLHGILGWRPVPRPRDGAVLFRFVFCSAARC